LAVRVDVSDGATELRSLAETFNTTAQQLGQMIESQRRFVADASHQLRTPLTALRLRLETLEPFVTEPAQPKLDAAIAETDRLARLVQSLLVLARSDATRTPCEPVDVSTAVMGRLDAWGPVAADISVRLVADCPPAVWARAVPGAVEQILDNLLSNALDAAPDDTEVTVRVTTDADVCRGSRACLRAFLAATGPLRRSRCRRVRPRPRHRRSAGDLLRRNGTSRRRAGGYRPGCCGHVARRTDRHVGPGAVDGD